MRFTTRPTLISLAILMLASPRIEANATSSVAQDEAVRALHRYQVREGCHLKEISLRLYGSPRYWREIARWNDIAGPRYVLRRGQWLNLQIPRKLSFEEGEKLVLEHWRKRFGLGEAEPRSLPSQPVRPVEPAEVILEEFEKEEEVQQVRAAEEGLGPSVEELQSEKSRDERFQVAQALFKSGKQMEALREFQALRQEDSTRPEYWLREIAALISLTRTSEARSLARKFADEKPELSKIPFIVRLLADPQGEGKP